MWVSSSKCRFYCSPCGLSDANNILWPTTGIANKKQRKQGNRRHAVDILVFGGNAEPGILCIHFIFCTNRVVQNMKIKLVVPDSGCANCVERHVPSPISSYSQGYVATTMCDAMQLYSRAFGRYMACQVSLLLLFSLNNWGYCLSVLSQNLPELAITQPLVITKCIWDKR